MPKFSPSLDSLGPPGVSSRPLGSQPSTPYVQCVRACVRYTHVHLHTLPPELKIEKTQTTTPSLLLSQAKITPHAKQFFFSAADLARVMRVAVPIPAVASASVFHSAAGGSVVDVVRPL